jgi:hypothetical protein
MDHGIKTPAPHVAPSANNVGDEATSQMQWVLDQFGRLVVIPAPDVAPPEMSGVVKSGFGLADTNALAKRNTQMPDKPCFAVIIRNTSGRYVRVNQVEYTVDADFDDDTAYNTIAPSFSKRLPCSDANEFWLSNADGAIGLEGVELTFEIFQP